ncbi:MAG: hypothetical protein RL204_1044 [Bacteroidota bacterium]|jgi:hypothetical protein
MKKILILPLLMFVLNVAAQIDTAYLPPFAYLKYDTQEWEMSDSENDRYSTIRLKGKIDKGFELKIRLNIGDTLITKENLLAKLEARTPYGSQMVLQSFDTMGEYYLGVFNFSQDECSRNDIPVMFKTMKFRAAFRIIDNTNLLTIEIDDDSFFFPEELQTQKIQNAVNAISVVTPAQLDKLLGLPLSKEKATILVEEAYNKKYKESFDFNLSKRKCFDDSYFAEELSEFLDYSEIDSLLNHGSDSTLCDLVAKHQAEMDSSSYANQLRSRVNIGFNYTEKTELHQRARRESFTLEEYLDFQLGETQEGPIQRLKDYSYQNSDYNDNDKYEQIIQKLFSKKYLSDSEIHNIFFESLGDQKYLMSTTATTKDTILETTFFHLQKNGKTYDVNKIILPNEYIIERNNDKSAPRVFDRIVFTEETIDYLYPIYFANINISPSPKKQLISLYDKMSGSSDFPAHISIGNSKDIKWIPLTPVALDSSKFLIAKKRPTDEYNEYVQDNTSLLWDEFAVASEKKRLNEFFKLEYGMSIDSAIALNNSPSIRFGDDYTISHYEIRSFIERNTYANYIVSQEQGFGDLNKDGREDVYSILICNGKVLDAKAYLIKENSCEIIGMKEVVKLLKDNTGFKNMILKSQIGNHGKNRINNSSDLYDLNQE